MATKRARRQQNTKSRSKNSRQSSSFWRSDFSEIDPRLIRIARIGMGMHALGRSISGKNRQVSGNAPELLTILLPLVDPAAMRDHVLQEEALLEPKTLETLTQLEDADLSCGINIDDMDAVIIADAILSNDLPALQKRLAAKDQWQPISPGIRLLVEALQLSETEQRLLDFVDHHTASDALRTMLRDRQSVSSRVHRATLSRMLELDPNALQAALKPGAPLRAFNLVDYEDEADMEDFLQSSAILYQLLDAEIQSVDELLAYLIEPCPAAAWSLSDFPHLHDATTHLSEALVAALHSGSIGINALFYGPPGTGKTEFARALAADCGLRVFQVRSSHKDRSGLDRGGRLSAYLMAQRLLSRRRDAILIFDEVEDVFNREYPSFGKRGQTGHQKGWINRILEDNQIPAIWITNNVSDMDPAFLRRFLLPLAFRTPPRSVRRQMVDRHLGAIGLSSGLLDDLAADDQLTPAQFGVARKLADLRAGTHPDQVARTAISAQRMLLRGSAGPRRREPATDFNAGFLNLDGEFTPAMILRALERLGRGSLCFYGPPGTGKTQFAEVLADALDRELIARQASDLISPYVGETEQNLAALFNGSDPGQSIILLDEVDSFLANRADAKRQWERTQVNELLQQMERFPGIFIAATNLMSGIDAAALRRFDFKLHFQPLKPEQRVALFAREVYGDAEVEVPALVSRNLAALNSLTVGDFANVCRQRALLDADWTPEQFLKRLVAECRLKQVAPQLAA